VLFICVVVLSTVAATGALLSDIASNVVDVVSAVFGAAAISLFVADIGSTVAVFTSLFATVVGLVGDSASAGSTTIVVSLASEVVFVVVFIIPSVLVVLVDAGAGLVVLSVGVVDTAASGVVGLVVVIVDVVGVVTTVVFESGVVAVVVTVDVVGVVTTVALLVATCASITLF
jgi:hypothetical protein